MKIYKCLCCRMIISSRYAPDDTFIESHIKRRYWRLLETWDNTGSGNDIISLDEVPTSIKFWGNAITAKIWTLSTVKFVRTKISKPRQPAKFTRIIKVHPKADLTFDLLKMEDGYPILDRIARNYEPSLHPNITTVGQIEYWERTLNKQRPLTYIAKPAIKILPAQSDLPPNPDDEVFPLIKPPTPQKTSMVGGRIIPNIITSAEKDNLRSRSSSLGSHPRDNEQQRAVQFQVQEFFRRANEKDEALGPALNNSVMAVDMDDPTANIPFGTDGLPIDTLAWLTARREQRRKNAEKANSQPPSSNTSPETSPANKIPRTDNNSEYLIDLTKSPKEGNSTDNTNLPPAEIKLEPQVKVENTSQGELIFNERGELVGIKLEDGDALECHPDGSYTLHESDTDPLQETQEDIDTRQALALSLADTTPPPASSTPTNVVHDTPPNPNLPLEELSFNPLDQAFDENDTSTNATTPPAAMSMSENKENEEENGEEGD